MDGQQQIVTAGAYVRVGASFVFQVGFTASGHTLGIVRLGGHREGKETGWQCAAREAYEEASLHIHPLYPPATYWGSSSETLHLQAGSWLIQDDAVPFLVTRRNEQQITPIYLASSDDDPRPGAEAQALLLLRPAEIAHLVTQPMTLHDYLRHGGQAVFRDALPREMLLEPLGHLRWLHLLLQLHPEIASSY